MKVEYVCLIIMSIFFLLAWAPASYGKLKSFGGKWLLSNRNPVTNKELLPWAARVERAHNNLKDNFPGFVVAILLMGLTNKFSDATAVASVVYVIGRFGHFISYAIGNVPMRGLFYMLALACNLFLLIQILF